MNVSFKTSDDLVRCLSLLKGAQICTIESTTPLKVNKRNSDKEHFDSHFDDTVYCTKTQSANVGINYENAVNKKREANGETPDFKAGKLTWGKWIKPNVLIEHNDSFYLRYYVGYSKNSSKTRYLYHYSDGTILGKASVEKLKTFMKELPKKDPDSVQPRNINLDNVQKLVVGGNTYVKM